MILMGLWLLVGQSIVVRASAFQRFADRVNNPKDLSVRGFFLLGLAYGAASLTCTLPVFLVVIGGGISAGGFLAGAGQFLGYGLGMASVLLTFTLALALFKQCLVTRLRKLIPYVQLASAVLIMLAGAYMIFYWW